jgi:hypothetical protein
VGRRRARRVPGSPRDFVLSRLGLPPSSQRFFHLSWHGPTVLRVDGYEIIMPSPLLVGVNDASVILALSLLKAVQEMVAAGHVKAALVYAENLDFIVSKLKYGDFLAMLVEKLAEGVVPEERRKRSCCRLPLPRSSASTRSGTLRAQG